MAATTISDLAVLRDQPDLFGEVASTPTAWRTLDAVDDAALERIAAARAEARDAGCGRGRGPRVLCDRYRRARLVTAHSDKTGAAPTYKRGFGFHPLLAFWTPPVKHSPGCCDRATPGRTPPPITSACSTGPRPAPDRPDRRWR